MEELILKILGPLGLPGLVIFALGISVWYLYRQLTKMNNSRLADVPILIKALENNAQATRENASAILARNQISEEQGRLIERLSNVLELFMQKVEIRDDAYRDKLSEFKTGFDALAESNRVNTGILKDVRDKLDNRGSSS